MDYRHIEVHPLSAAIGAEVTGVDLSAPTIEQHVIDDVRQALL